MKDSDVTAPIIGAAIDVHRRLGPGLLESAYRVCLAHELSKRSVICECEVPMPILYDGVSLDCGYRIDLIANHSVVVELKSVAAIEPIHKAQLLSYMRLGKYSYGLLINFNVMMLKDGVRRMVLREPDRVR